MIKILLLTDSAVFAGTERHIFELASGLQSLGVETLVGCPGQGILAARCAAAGIPLLPLEKGGIFDFQAVLALARGLRRRRFDIVHTHNGRTAFLAALAVRLARRGHLVTTEHFLSPAHSQRRGWKAVLSRWVHRWILRSSSKVIAISQVVRDAMLRRHPLKPDKITVVLNGIESPSSAELVPRESVRSSLGITSQAELIVAVARLEKEKGLDVLIRAIPIVTAQVPGVRCVIVGEGAERPRLEALIVQEGVTAAVSLIGFRTDVPSMIAAADVFVLPSPAEPFGLVLLEAMSLGVPTVASRAGGPIEIVADGQTGLLVTPDDAAAFAAAIVRVLQEPVWSGAAPEKARRRFAERFTAQTMASRMHDAYRDIFAAR